jgi:hypothetical protein
MYEGASKRGSSWRFTLKGVAPLLKCFPFPEGRGLRGWAGGVDIESIML